MRAFVVTSFARRSIKLWLEAQNSIAQLACREAGQREAPDIRACYRFRRSTTATSGVCFSVEHLGTGAVLWIRPETEAQAAQEALAQGGPVVRESARLDGFSNNRLVFFGFAQDVERWAREQYPDPLPHWTNRQSTEHWVTVGPQGSEMALHNADTGDTQVLDLEGLCVNVYRPVPTS